MRRILISMFLGMFSFGVAFGAQDVEQEHTKEYLKWRENTTKYLNLSSRRIKTENNVRKLADAIKAKYGKSQNKDEVESLLSYIEWLHKSLLILERDSGASGLAGTKLSDIPGVSYSADEPTRWLIEELLKAMALLDDLAYVADKIPRDAQIISSSKLNNIRFLHVTVRTIQNGGDLIKALQDVDAFQEKLKQ